MVEIIEDNSPYYVRFKIDPAKYNVVVNIANKILQSKPWPRLFVSEVVLPDDCVTIAETVPELIEALHLNKRRVNLFVSNPGYYGIPHKDGANMSLGVNFTIRVADDKCITKWYSDEKLKDYTYFNGEKFNGRQFRPLREITDFNPGDEEADMTMTALEGECILFNVGMFHDFDNRASTNQRVVLTLRQVPDDQMSFEEARDILVNMLAKSS